MHQPPEPAITDATSSSCLCREHAHALKNIFSIIIANTEMIGEENALGLMHRRLKRIIEASRRGEHLVEQIRTNTRTAQPITSTPVS